MFIENKKENKNNKGKVKMKALFVASLELSETEGIYKKVNAQAEAIGKVVGKCDLVTRKGKKAKVKDGETHNVTESNDDFLDYVLKEIHNSDIGLVYIRHMIPNFKLIKVLKAAQRKGIKIYYEIPTYPYFGEQFKASKRKHRAIAKILIDVFFWPVIYKYIDKLVVIRSNSKTKSYSKMVEITNGVKTDEIVSKDYNANDSENEKVFRMVAVGTLYPYHGYDRVLKGLQQCNEQIDDTIVEFHVIGNSFTIDELKKSADDMGLKHVKFHGVKTTEELNVLYENFHVGLGCLALHRRNADIDTTLKIIEYYCRGVPVITSGKSPLNDNRFTLTVTDNDKAVDIKQIFDFYRNLDKSDLTQLSSIAKEQFSWINIMHRLIVD
ncbi:MAG: glycosyltransferase [Acutalibacteraceae bacterium]